MSASLLSLGAALFTGVIVLMLGLNDPKRRRTLGLRAKRLGRHRAALACLALLPGAALLAMSHGAAFLIWLGSAGVIGWTATLLLGATRRRVGTR